MNAEAQGRQGPGTDPRPAYDTPGSQRPMGVSRPASKRIWASLQQEWGQRVQVHKRNEQIWSQKTVPSHNPN